MANEPDPNTPPAGTDPKGTPANPNPAGDPPGDLGASGQEALKKERKARRDAETKARELEQRLQQLEDKDKPELDRLRASHDAISKELADIKPKYLRLQVGMEKGLSAAQARRLVGDTQEDLEADADELLADFGGKAPGTPPTTPPGTPPGGKPREHLAGGGDPEQQPEETDPAKLAAQIPRF